MTERFALWLLLLLTLPVAWALAQKVPMGEEFQVNLTTAGPQTNPAVAPNDDENFVVVWESSGDGGGKGVFARRFDASNAPMGEEFQVNSFTTGRQSRPAVASDIAGNFVVVWESEGQDGAEDGVFGQLFNPSGMRMGSEFQVNSFTSGRQYRPAVAADSAGNFVIVWESEGQDGSNSGIYGRRFSPSGEPMGFEFRVNQFTSHGQETPSVSVSDSGAFVVVWQSDGQDESGDGIVGRLFDPSGLPVSEDFVVNSFTMDAQRAPAVASDPAGNFVVVWQSQGQDGEGKGVFGQLFDASGTPMGGEFRANVVTAKNQEGPWIARDSSGSFLVVWTSAEQDGSGKGVFARLYDPEGEPMGEEVRINTTTEGNQRAPRVASDGNGNFMVVWQSQGQDGDGFGIFGRR